MSGTRRTNQRSAPTQRRLPTRNYNDPFLLSPTTQTENQVYHTNKQYGYQRSHNAVPNAARSGWNQRTSGRSRGRRGTNLVGISGGSAMPRIGFGIPFKPLQTSFCNERVVNRVEETLEPILKFTEFPEDFLIHVLLPCIPSEKAAILVAGVLLCAAKRMGKDKIGKLWRESKLRWQDLYKFHSKDVENFIKKNQLEFLAIPTNSEALLKTLNVIETQEIIEKVKKILSKLLGIYAENEMIYRYIDMRLQSFMPFKSAFIHALVLAVLESAISGTNSELNKTQLNSRIPLLKRYINNNVNLELQALYALQSLMQRLRHPKGLLRQIFQMLYDADVIKKKTFSTWEFSTDPQESEGKTAAVISVNVFLKGLVEVDSNINTMTNYRHKAHQGRDTLQSSCSGKDNLQSYSGGQVQRNISPPVAESKCCVS